MILASIPAWLPSVDHGPGTRKQIFSPKLLLIMAFVTAIETHKPKPKGLPLSQLRPNNIPMYCVHRVHAHVMASALPASCEATAEAKTFPVMSIQPKFISREGARIPAGELQGLSPAAAPCAWPFPAGKAPAGVGGSRSSGPT